MRLLPASITARLEKIVMIVTCWGTRGSTPVSGPEQVRYGGNTTCISIASQCLSEGHWLAVDAGTGMIPMGKQFMKSGGKALTLLQSHWHHDHTQGLLLAPFTYAKIPMHIYGPRDGKYGPGEVYSQLMQAPLFPRNWQEVASAVNSHTVDYPNATTLIFHPKGGRREMNMKMFDSLMAKKEQIPFREASYDVDECLVIKIKEVNHPNTTVCYRFEERPTGQVFVFLTDHENQDGNHAEFLAHLKGADLLLMDTQYTRDLYDSQCAGYGHATPDYAAKIAALVGAKALGTTHHDPNSTDERCDQIVATVRDELVQYQKNPIIFGARDYLTIDVGNVSDSVSSIL